ncbi:MAG: SBBP repeat-containing protein [Promethearchaeota archaeon]
MKYTSSGTLEWNSTWETTTSSSLVAAGGFGVAIDSSDDVYIVGTTSYYNIYNISTKTIILLKYDQSGTQLWNRTLGDIINNTEGVSIVIDSLDNIYFTGIWERSYNEVDIILAKYDQSGTQLWNRTWGGSGSDEVSEIVVDSLDNIYVTGIISQVGFFVKFDGDGVVKWNVTTPSIGYGKKLAIDSSNNVYILSTGYYTNNLTKFSSSGVLQWETTVYHSDVALNDIVLDSLNNIYFVGTSYDPYHHIALMQCNSSGAEQWTISLAWGKYEYGEAIAIDSLGNIYLAGNTYFEVILVKLSKLEEEEGEEGKEGGGKKIILGYPLLIFLSTIGLLTIFSLKKKFN